MIEYNYEVDFQLQDEKMISDWINKTLNNEQKKIDTISYIFCSEDYILSINQQYLNHDYYTDIITFDYTEESTISGDIFISIDTVKSNALLYSYSFETELHRVIIHGILHLCGYKDKTDEEIEIMRTKENYYLEKLYKL